MTFPNKSTLAYSYIRFSTAEQRNGDSLRRQTELAEAYCRRRRWTLSTATYRDLGVSAFKGKNALVGNLGEFVKAIKSGMVKPGSVLIVESIDRMSRQGIDEGYDLIKSILKAGIIIVTLSPEREFDVLATKSLSKGALEMQLILERAAEESERKSERVGAAWARKKQAAKEGDILTNRLPGWVRRKGDKLVLIPDATAVVQQIFRLAASGYGVPSIIKKLEADGIPTIGRSGRWTRAYIGTILNGRRVLGEYQPRDRNGKPQGDPIKNYYPAVVTEDEWLQARAGVQQRRRFKGRVSEAQVNIFARLLRHARDGDIYIMFTRFTRGRTPRKFQALINSEGDQGKTRAYSLPYAVFEAAILSCLREIAPHDILDGGRPPDDRATLAGELVALEAELTDAAAFMDKNGFSPTIGKRIADLEARKGKLMERLAEARHLAAHPLSESWGECQSWANALATAPDSRDARLRLRSALRRIVDGMWLLVVARGQDRLAAVQLDFAGGGRRNYLLIYRPAGRLRPGRWWAAAVKHPDDVSGLNDWDLRNRGQLTAEQLGRRVNDAGADWEGVDEVAELIAFLEDYSTEMIDRLLSEGGHPIH